MKNIETVARIVLFACVATILWIALSPNPPNPAGLLDLDKVNHVGAFFVLSLLADYSYLARSALVPKGMALFGFGFLIEGLQYGVGYRFFEVADLIADGGGMVLYWLVRNPVRAMLDPIIIRKG